MKYIIIKRCDKINCQYEKREKKLKWNSLFPIDLLTSNSAELKVKKSWKILEYSCTTLQNNCNSMSRHGNISFFLFKRWEDERKRKRKKAEKSKGMENGKIVNEKWLREKRLKNDKRRETLLRNMTEKSLACTCSNSVFSDFIHVSAYIFPSFFCYLFFSPFGHIVLFMFLLFSDLSFQCRFFFFIFSSCFWAFIRSKHNMLMRYHIWSTSFFFFSFNLIFLSLVLLHHFCLSSINRLIDLVLIAHLLLLYQIFYHSNRFQANFSIFSACQPIISLMVVNNIFYRCIEWNAKKLWQRDSYHSILLPFNCQNNNVERKKLYKLIKLIYHKFVYFFSWINNRICIRGMK